MPWCPKCGAEFRAGFDTCNHCRVALIDHPPDGTERFAQPSPQEQKRLRRECRRTHLLRILRALIMVLLALAAALLVSR